MNTRTLPALAVVVIALAGCSAYDDYAAAERVQAESNRTVASTQLQSTIALSNTVGVLASQNERLTQTVVNQAGQVAEAWAISAVILGVGLAASVILAVSIVLTRRRVEPQAPTYYILPNSPTHDAPLLLDDANEWPEVKARRRAARLLSPQERYQLTARTRR